MNTLTDNIKSAYRKYQGDTDLVDLVIEEIDSAYIETPRGLYETLVTNFTHHQMIISLGGLFEYGNEVTIETALTKMMQAL